MKQAALYCRLSKEDRDKIEKGDESESIRNQKLLLEDFARKQGFSVYDTYCDEDYSGLDSQRPAFHRMIADAKRGCFQAVLCKSQSRFTRDMEQVETYLHGLFPLLGIRFMSVIDHADTEEKGNKKARQINGLVNEWYCEDLSENIRGVFKRKREEGQYLGAFPPYGYEKDPKDHHRLQVDAEPAEVVQKIFRWYLEGMGIQRIRNRLYEEGTLPPSLYKKQKYPSFSHAALERKTGVEYGFWSCSTIRKILTNPVYLGAVVQGKERKVSYKSKKTVAVPKEDWVVVSHMHEPIISEGDFLQVQRMMEERRYDTKPNTKEENIKSLLAGKVFCAHCGQRMYRVQGRNGKDYFYCQVFSKSKGRECRHNSIREDILEDVVRSKLRNLTEMCLQEEENRKKLREALYIQEEKAQRIYQRQREKEEKHLYHLQRAVALVYVDESKGKVSKEAGRELRGTLEGEIRTQKKILSTLAENEKRKEQTMPLQKKSMEFDYVHRMVERVEIGAFAEDSIEICIYWCV